MAARRAHWLFAPAALAALWAAATNPAAAQRRPVAPARDAGAPDVSPVNSQADGGTPDAPPPDAPPPDDSEARRERAASEWGLGMNDYRRGDFASAAAHFQAAYDSLPDPAPLFNMARSWEAANEISRALTAYERYLAAAPEAPDRQEVLARIALLRQRPIDVFVTSQPTGAFVFVDGSAEPLPGATPLVARLQPGRHSIALVRDGFSRSERAVEVRPGERQTVALQLNPDEPGGAPASGSRLDPVILDRRVAIPFATRAAFVLGVARTFEAQPFSVAFGGDFSLFYRRNFVANARLTRVEPDGASTLGSLGAGYVLPIEDLDLAALGHVGAAYGYHQPDGAARGLPRQWDALVGAELRVDWYFHRRLSLGAFFRGDLLTDFTPSLRFQSSLGAAIGLTP